MRRLHVAISLALMMPTAAAAGPPPIIDMHLHVRAARYAGDKPPPMCTPFEVMPRSDPRQGIYEGMTFNKRPCTNPILPAKTDDAVRLGTLAAMERLNIYGVVSGEPEPVARWTAAAPNRIMPAIDYRLAGTPGARHVAHKTLEELRRLHAQGRLTVIGEIMAQYEGVGINDPRMDPLWALAEELDVPVAIHMGPGEPGQPYSGGAYRVALGDPLLLEPVLVRHPKLRVSVMYAAYPLADRMRALLFSYPQVYVEIGGIVYTEPRSAFYSFLRDLVEAGYGDRIMFGSDQMIWPGVIEASVRTVEEAPFLTAEQSATSFTTMPRDFLG